MISGAGGRLRLSDDRLADDEEPACRFKFTTHSPSGRCPLFVFGTGGIIR